MPHFEITSLNDPRLEPYRNLKDTNKTRWEGLFIGEGEKLVERLLRSDFETLSVLLGQSFLPRWQDRLPEQVPVLVVPDPWVEQLIGFNFHRGVLACGKRKLRTHLDEAIQRDASRLLLVVCPEINDPENLGAIIRSAAAFRVDALMLGPRSCDPFSRRVLRVSMGAGLKLPILQPLNPLDELRILRDDWQIDFAATVLDPNAEPLHQSNRRNRQALVFGSEAHGLSEEWLAACNRKITIPMPAGVDSLNVATATGIFLYHFTAGAET